MKTDESNPQDWLRSAHSRLRSADLLYPIEGASASLSSNSCKKRLKGSSRHT